MSEGTWKLVKERRELKGKIDSAKTGSHYFEGKTKFPKNSGS